MSAPINDGGPFHAQLASISSGVLSKTSIEHPGISLRAWLAGQALPALLMQATDEEANKFGPESFRQRLAQGSVLIADAVISELSKQ